MNLPQAHGIKQIDSLFFSALLIGWVGREDVQFLLLYINWRINQKAQCLAGIAIGVKVRREARLKTKGKMG